MGLCIAGTAVARADSNNRTWAATGVVPGFQSQRETPTSSQGALVLAHDDCTFTVQRTASPLYGTVTWDMRKNRSLAPDEDLGTLTGGCYTNQYWYGNAYRNYGAPAPATYFFQYQSYNQSTIYNGQQHSDGEEKW